MTLRAVCTLIACLLAFLVTPSGRVASAQTPRCSAARLAEIRTVLQQAKRHTRIWSYSWAGGYTAIAIGNLVLSQTASDHDSRVDYYFGLGGSVIGMGIALIGPLREIREEGRLEKRIAALGGDSRPLADDEVCLLVAEGERSLREVARMQEQSQSPLVHLGNVVFNAGLGVGLGAGFGRWRSAFIQAVGGTFIGEVMTLTHPVAAIRAWQRLEVRPQGAGLAAVLTFD